MRTRLSGARAVCAALVLAAALPARADRLTIDQALRRALQRHPDVEVAAADLEAAGGQVTAARTRTYNPELGVAAGPAWGGGDTVLDYELSLSQTFELGGRGLLRRVRFRVFRLVKGDPSGGGASDAGGPRPTISRP